MRKPSSEKIRMAEEGRILAKMDIDDFVKKAQDVGVVGRAQWDALFEKVAKRIQLAEDIGLLKKRIIRPVSAKGAGSRASA